MPQSLKKRYVVPLNKRYGSGAAFAVVLAEDELLAEFDAVVVLAADAGAETEVKVVEAGVKFAGGFVGAGVGDAATGIVVGPSAKTGDGASICVNNNAVAIKSASETLRFNFPPSEIRTK